MKEIVGVDLSLAGAAWARYRAGDPETAIESAVISTKGLFGLARLDHILCEMAKLFPKEQGAASQLFVIEDFAFHSHKAFVLGGQGYLFRYQLWSEGIPYVLVAPSTLKKFVTGSGNSDKNIVLKEILKRWEIDVNDDNQGDAISLVQIGRALFGNLSKVTKVQSEIIQAIRLKNKELEGAWQLDEMSM